MNEFDFDIPVDRTNTGSLKWDKYRRQDILPMWVADMDFRSPPAIAEALKIRTEHEVFGYTVPLDTLYEIIIPMLETKYRWEIDRDWIVWLPGLVTGLNVSCRAVGEAGDAVMSAVPVYPPFLTAPGHFRRHLIRVPLVQNADAAWTFDFDRMKKKLPSRTRLFLLCNPHNPVGRVFTRKELTTLAEICEEHRIVICSDEIHCDLILDSDKRHIPLATLSPEISKRTITLMAPSKTYNIPGLGCSFAIISDPELRKSFKGAMAGIVPDINIMGFVAAAAAYANGDKWLRALLAYLGKNRDAVIDAIKRIPGLSINHVEATYLAWIDARPSGLESPATFFENAGVGLSDGQDFGSPDFLRLNFACPRQVLDIAMEKMAAAMNNR